MPMNDTASPPLPAINSALDIDALRDELQERGRIHIPDFLAEESARSMHELLAGPVPWKIAYNEGEQAVEADPEKVEALQPQHRQQFINQIMKGAASGFQYLYNYYNVTDAAEHGLDEGHPIHMLNEFANGEAFMDFLKRMTKREDIIQADVFAGKFGPGHFLLDHDDAYEKHGRVAAYVLNMTPQWRADWGGHLVFYDDQGNIIDGLVPTFNALNMFLVPASHAVTYVTPFAGASRFTVTGWAREIG